MRREAWRRVRDGAASVVVGARSAVFAPFADLRLIVVDEEHEAAYKQDETPRYHGRDVAIYRGHLARVPVVLGSATPSLESFHHALAGKYALIELPRRIDDRPTPTVDLVPLLRGRDEARPESPPAAGRSRSHVLSEPLIEALEERLTRAEQAILFLNRRGHSTVVRCGDCGHVARCPHCDISLTWHADRRELCCHYCSHRVRQFDVCPDCAGTCFVYRGVGTQKVEAELQRLLPQARTVRMDFDSTRRRGVLDGIVRDFRARRADILLGTQMVARGLDFPGVTLVGVINADTQLNLPDFRSAERTFQLLTQVAGRAGRGRQPGHVLVQTFAAGHYAIEAARRQDYRAFYETEIEFRREVGYPPLSRMVNLLFDGREEARVTERAEEVARHLSARLGGQEPGVDLLGPAPQSLSRLKGKYRWHVTLKGRDHRALRSLAEEALALPASTGSAVRLSVDVDPVSLL
jgi:primosomal protein N' (replication factor Y)